MADKNSDSGNVNISGISGEDIDVGNIITGHVEGDVVGRDKIITNIYEAPPPPLPPAEARERRDLGILLRKVKQFWIEGVLEKSVHNMALIDLGKETQAEAVAHAWEQILELPDQSRQTLPPDKKISQIFDEMNRALLILGEPGSGKTITLLQLARDLIVQVEGDETFSQPVPVVFNLSTWAKGQSLIDWLVEELTAKYQIPKRIGRPWLENNRLLPLLDGLDEVRPDDRAACVEAINFFGEEFGLAGLVVCSRLKEYTDLPVRLKLNGAILLQPLTLEQVYDYLDQAGSKLEALQIALQEDETLKELAQSPLTLGIMSLAYQDLPAEALADQSLNSVEARRKHLFDTYLERMFRRKGQGEKLYTDKQTKRQLSWLAQKMIQHNRTEFLIEQLQPNWLPTHLQKWLYICNVILAIWIPVGLLIGLGRGVFLRPTVGWVFGISMGLAVGLTIWSVIRRTFGLIGGLSIGGAFGLAVGLTFGLNYNASVGVSSGLAFGIASGFMFSLIDKWAIQGANVKWDKIEVVEKLSWSWSKAMLGLVVGLVAGFIFGLASGEIVWPPVALEFGLAFSLAGGLIAGLFSGLTSGKIDLRTTPNQGIRQSVRNSVRIGLLVSLAVGLPIAVISGLIWTSLPGRVDTLSANVTVGLSIGGTLGVTFGMVTSLFFGGLATIQHYTLRLILWYKGYTPRNYAHFLDYAAEHLFLQKVGGGYIFIHRLLLEHFASLEPEQ